MLSACECVLLLFSGSLGFCERFERDVGGALTHCNHPINCRRARHITGRWNLRMDMNICVGQREPVM